MEEVKTGESWNKKKIIITAIILALLIAGGFYLRIRILGQNSSQMAESVKGAATQEVSVQDIKEGVQEAVKEKIDNLKAQVSNLNVSEIASSSPQVQKIINDIKSLGQYPANQAKEFCKQIYEKICGGL
jgi:ABC-type transport system involved in cytochrome bd biosynthesis fused ATPase/permease subunit